MRRGEIYYIEDSRFYQTFGSEMLPGRPAIIVSNNSNNTHSSVIEVVYLTTQPKHDLPTHVTINSSRRTSTALCEQVTSVSIYRLGEYIGTCSKPEMRLIDDALAVSLGIAAGKNITGSERKRRNI